MRSSCFVRGLRPFLTLSVALLLSAGAPEPVAARPDDDPAELRKELDEKIAKCLKKAAEAQRKYAEKMAKRAQDEKEDKTEAQQEAREKSYKDARAARRKTAGAAHDTAKMEDEALDELEDRVEDYVKKVHKKAAKQVAQLPPQATPEQIVAHQRALGDAIRALRPQAKPGDLFLPEVQPIIKRVIAEQLAGRAGAPARREVLAGNPPIDPDHDDRMQIRVAVNAVYPTAAPLSTVPPTVVLSLPLLRKEVEYHFVNRDLVLLDIEANMILDYIRAAAPPLATTAAVAPARKR